MSRVLLPSTFMFYVLSFRVAGDSAGDSSTLGASVFVALCAISIGGGAAFTFDIAGAVGFFMRSELIGLSCFFASGCCSVFRAEEVSLLDTFFCSGEADSLGFGSGSGLSARRTEVNFNEYLESAA